MNKERPAEASVVLSLAAKTLDAIRNKDTKFLARLADPGGVTIGVDVDKMSAARFKKELAEKRGVYCMLFDVSCLGNEFDKSSATSLREDLEREPVTMKLSEIEGEPHFLAVAIKSAARPDHELFRLIYRRVRGKWVLEQIEYL